MIGRGDWNFNAAQRTDRATLIGTRGSIIFSVFDETPMVLKGWRRCDEVMIENPQPIQLPHVAAINRHLAGGPRHPSMIDSGLRTAWVSEQILRGVHTLRLTC